MHFTEILQEKRNKAFFTSHDNGHSSFIWQNLFSLFINGCLQSVQKQTNSPIFKSSRFLVSFFHLNIKASAFGSLVQKIVAESGETMCLINFAFSVKKISYSLRLENVPFLYSNLILLIPSREPIQRRSISMLF